MNNSNQEKGLEELVGAMNTTLPKDVIFTIGYKIQELKPLIAAQGNYKTNRAITGTYLVLLDETQLGPRMGKNQFNIIHKKSIDNVIKWREKEIFSGSLVETLNKYINIAMNSEISVEPNGNGIKIEMKNGCEYQPFCSYTGTHFPGKEKCIMGAAIKHIVNYHEPKPYQFLLEKQEGLKSCTIRVIPNIDAFDVIKEYKQKNQSAIVL